MKIFSDFDVYDHKYTYDEMKVMCVLCGYDDITADIDYEDLMLIANAIYKHWIRDVDDDNIYIDNEWLEYHNSEEEGYIQAYADRVAPDFIQLYKEKKQFVGGII